MTFPALCPRCRQGPDLHRVRVPEIDRVLFICHECDATFESEADIAQNRFTDLAEYLNRFGLTPMTITEDVTNVV